MGIFKKNEKKEAKILLAMPLFCNNEWYDIAKVIEHLKEFWGLNVGDIDDANNEAAVFSINGQMVAIAQMPAPVPNEELESAAAYSYAWNTAMDELKNHTNHAIVSVLSGNQPTTERYSILSKMLCSILMTSNCTGVYQGSQTLLLSKEYYLEFVEYLQDDEIPVPLWVYIGIRREENGISLYTYGLDGFDKNEMEIIDSRMDFDDVYDFIMNITSYVISGDVTLRHGETIGYSATHKVPVKLSKGVYLEGQETIKLVV